MSHHAVVRFVCNNMSHGHNNAATLSRMLCNNTRDMHAGLEPDSDPDVPTVDECNARNAERTKCTHKEPMRRTHALRLNNNNNNNNNGTLWLFGLSPEYSRFGCPFCARRGYVCVCVHDRRSSSDVNIKDIALLACLQKTAFNNSDIRMRRKGIAVSEPLGNLGLEMTRGSPISLFSRSYYDYGSRFDGWRH